MKHANAATAELSLYEAATQLQLPPAVVYQLAAAGLLPAKERGRQLSIARDSLASWARLWGERLKLLYSTHSDGQR